MFSLIIEGINLIADYTLGLILKGIFYLLALILPKEYTLIITDFSELFWSGIKNTMFIALVGTLLGFLIAMFLGSIRTIKIKEKDHKMVKVGKVALQSVVKTYVTVFRGTPMIVQAMIIFYGLVGVLKWSAVTAGLFTVTINTAAYLTEVVKDGILSVDNGQYEAARSLGFSHIRTMILVIFPQALKNSISSIGNEFIINIKDTSVLNVIGCAEMFFVLKTSSAIDYNYMEQMIVGAIIYLILTYSTTKLLHFVEKKLDAPVKELKGSN